VTFNDAGADVDFRIESDDEANMFFVDGSTDRVGIGTVSPGARLEIVHGTGAQPLTSGGDATSTALRIGNTGSNNTVLDFGADSSVNKSWIQSRNRGNLATNYAYPLVLNPNGGAIGINGAPAAGYQLHVTGWSDQDASAARFDMDIAGTGFAESDGIVLHNDDQTANSEMYLRFDFTDNSDTTHTQDGGCIGFHKSELWTSTASTRNSYFTVACGYEGATAERMRVRSTGRLGLMGPGGDFNNIDSFVQIEGYGNTSTMYSGDSGSALRLMTVAASGGAEASRRGVLTIYSVSDGSNHAIGLLSEGTSDCDLNLGTRRSNGAGSVNLRLKGDGSSEFEGSLAKASGSFKIPHPHPSKNATHKLVHSFIEGPKADLIYRGTATLSAGTVTVDLDEAAGLTTGTWVLLCRDEQCYTTNETGWHHVRGSVSGSILTIDCEEECDDVVSWMVVACRKDQHMYDTTWTDADGYPIVEIRNDHRGTSSSPSASASPSE